MSYADKETTNYPHDLCDALAANAPILSLIERLAVDGEESLSDQELSEVVHYLDITLMERESNGKHEKN